MIKLNTIAHWKKILTQEHILAEFDKIKDQGPLKEGNSGKIFFKTLNDEFQFAVRISKRVYLLDREVHAYEMLTECTSNFTTPGKALWFHTSEFVPKFICAMDNCFEVYFEKIEKNPYAKYLVFLSQSAEGTREEINCNDTSQCGCIWVQNDIDCILF